MPRIKLSLPDKIHFTSEVSIRITDLNYGNHLANDKILSLCHQARVELLSHFNYDEFNIEGIGIIMSDAAIQFITEGKFGMHLLIDTTISELTSMGFSIYYHLKDKATDKTIAKAKTGMVFFNYQTHKVSKIPEAFQNQFDEV